MPETLQQLSGQDAMFIHTELDGLPQHIGGVSIYNQATAEGGVLRFKRILELMHNRKHLLPILSRKLVRVPMNLDQPYWTEDPDFDMEFHVRHIALPAPGDWRQLCILVSRLHSQPLDMNKPMWEMYIIEGLDNVEGLPPNCFAMLMKVHHAAMDGATGARLIPMLHDLSPEITEYDAPEWQAPSAQPGNLQLLRRAYTNNLRKPSQAFNLVKNALPAWQRIRSGKKSGAFKSLSDKQTTRFQGKISRHRVVDATKLPFEDLRSCKAAVSGATVNDTVLTVVAGGLRRYLEAKNELPEQTLVTGCPIDVRTEEERSAGGNMVGFMNVALRTDVADPLERLQAVHDEAQRSKAYAEALGPRIAMDVTDVMPGGMLNLAMRAAQSTGLAESGVIHNTIVTNVPGPPVQLYFCGAELVDGFSLGPLMPNMGLFHVVYSAVQNKQGTITISFTACREMMPDPAFYAQCLEDSFEELKQACGVGS